MQTTHSNEANRKTGLAPEFIVPGNETTPPYLIKVIGVGGGGGNAVRHMAQQGIKDVEFILCNTDRQVLDSEDGLLLLQLGSTGLGTGGDPQKGKEAAEESIEQIRHLFDDGTNMAFITAGMGGGTGTGAAPIVASVAKEMGVLTVGIVTLPFLFERPWQIRQALRGLAEMRKSVDALIVINNERLRALESEGDLPVIEAFQKADDILAVATRSIAEIVTVLGIVNRDFNDVNTIMRDGGSSIIVSGRASGPHRVREAIVNALHSPLLQENDITRARKLLYVLYASRESPIRISEIADVNRFTASFPPDVRAIWGMYEDETLGEDVKITIIATGLDSQPPAAQTPDELSDDDIIALYYEGAVPNETASDAADETAAATEIPVAAPENPVAATENKDRATAKARKASPLRERIARVNDLINHFMSD